MSRRDRDLIQQAVAGLEDETRAQPDAWRRRLDAARTQSLRRGLRAAPARWAWAGAAAAVALAALLLVALPRPGEEPAPPPVAEADMYEDMEFYLWLAEELESPSGSRS